MFEIRREDLTAYHHLITHWTGSCTPKSGAKPNDTDIAGKRCPQPPSSIHHPRLAHHLGTGPHFSFSADLCWFLESCLAPRKYGANGPTASPIRIILEIVFYSRTCALGCPPVLSKCRKWSCAACDTTRKREKTHGMNGRSLTWHWKMSHLFKNTTTAP